MKAQRLTLLFASFLAIAGAAYFYFASEQGDDGPIAREEPDDLVAAPRAVKGTTHLRKIIHQRKIAAADVPAPSKEPELG